MFAATSAPCVCSTTCAPRMKARAAPAACSRGEAPRDARVAAPPRPEHVADRDAAGLEPREHELAVLARARTPPLGAPPPPPPPAARDARDGRGVARRVQPHAAARAHRAVHEPRRDDAWRAARRARARSGLRVGRAGGASASSASTSDGPSYLRRAGPREQPAARLAPPPTPPPRRAARALRTTRAAARPAGRASARRRRRRGAARR